MIDIRSIGEYDYEQLFIDLDVELHGKDTYAALEDENLSLKVDIEEKDFII